MARMSIKEFAYEFPNDSSWAQELAKGGNVVTAFMIEFAQPGFLAGPFGESHGLLTIADHRKGTPKPLVTETEAYNAYLDRQSLNQFHWPRGLAEKAGLPTVHEYLRGRHRKGTLEPVEADDFHNSQHFMTKNTLASSATLDHPFVLTENYSSFEMNGNDMIALFRHMTETMDKNAILATLGEVERKIDGSIKSHLAHEAASDPVIERPFLLRLCGNDDASWSKTFPDAESAIAFADELEAKASYSFVTGNLDFTN